jgi:hypothetical protein
VDVFVRKLRQKLEKRSPSWSYIHTHFGVGYRFEPDPGPGAGDMATGPAPAIVETEEPGETGQPLSAPTPAS